MKTANFIVIIFISIILLLAGRSFFNSKSSVVENHWHEEDGEAKFTADDWHFRQRAFPYGTIDGQAIQEAMQHRQQQIKRNKSLVEKKLNNTPWEFAGPTNIGGRVTDIEIIKGTPDAILVGSAAGGIFRTTDMGDNWQPVFDDALSLAIGDMDVAPTNPDIIYVGTGEANAGGGSLAYDGMGIYQSTDGGFNWNHLGLMNIGSVGRVAVAIDDPNTCYVAAMGHLFENNSERGVYRTEDGGASWEQVLFINDSTGVVDLVLHPDNPEIIYAAAWQRVRRPDYRAYGGPSSGIYKSEDGGASWEKLTVGLPESAGRIGLSISESSPNILYASIVDENSGNLKNIYKTQDDGQSWNGLGMSGITDVPYMWWFGRLQVAPDNPNEIYFVGFFMHKSVNGGNTWDPIFAGAHVDQHAVCIDPDDPNFVLIGNDGGVYQSSDGGANNVKLNGLPITQFYACEIDPTAPHRLYGGTQDNSSMRTLTGNIDEWDIIYFGDGFQCLVDPTDNSFVYTEAQYGSFVKSNNGGQGFFGATTGIASADRNNWNTPVIFHPNNPEILYLGTNRLYKTENRAELWFPLSQDVTTNPVQNNLVYGTITTISVSPVDDEIIYVGTDDGRIQRFEDGGSSTNNANLSPVTNRWVTNVSADPDDAAGVFATFSGYRYGDNVGHVYYSLDYGDSWTDISGDLPDIPVNDIIIVPVSKMLIVGTDAGVYFSLNGGANWELLGLDLPNVVITDLDYHPETNLLVSASYGRGMFTISLEEWSVGTTQHPDIYFALNVFPNPITSASIVEMEVKKNDKYKIAVVDQLGRTVGVLHQGALGVGRHSFALNEINLQDGIFTLTVANENGNILKSVPFVK